ncbi:hypothetical protein B0H15DRAFT_653845 [Mycena belliarum]|uniref:Secreted protein n=1 Tax=Mycena belliarum TaxID=1033014 RepID=A0AAD6XMG7_9AGAR|nr:hypothetical protein B0H15DRAFT_653845 [Mycena belliae]
MVLSTLLGLFLRFGAFATRMSADKRTILNPQEALESHPTLHFARLSLYSAQRSPTATNPCESRSMELDPSNFGLYGRERATKLSPLRTPISMRISLVHVASIGFSLLDVYILVGRASAGFLTNCASHSASNSKAARSVAFGAPSPTHEFRNYVAFKRRKMRPAWIPASTRHSLALLS